MEINQEDIYNIFRGEAILFLGAGFSIKNANSHGEILPSAKTLSKVLQSEAGIPVEDIDENIDLGTASEYFINEVGKSRLVELLKEKFIVSDTLNWQKDLLKYPWSRIYTTNYDNVVELSSTLIGNHRKTIDVGTSEDTSELADSVVHINGFVDNITEENLYDSTKLTSTSYADTHFINSSWNTELTQSFKYARSIFFIGFSMDSDLDLKRIVASQEDIRNKVYFINAKVSPIKKVPLEKFGTVTELDGEQFTKLILREESNYVPRDESREIKTYSFLPSRLKPTSKKVDGRNVMDLLTSGKIDENILFSNYDTSKYIMFRENITDILTNINKFDLFVVLSYLGNGKTIFLKTLESALINKGYRVFVYSKNPSKIYHDIEALNKISNDKCCIIIDDYYSIKSQFNLLKNLNKKFKLIISGRRTLHGNNIKHFKKASGITDSKTHTISLDRLTRKEQTELQKIIENNNIWGSNSSKSDDEKLRFIIDKSKQGISEFVIEFIHSTNMLDRYYKEYSELAPSVKEIVLLTLINNILGLDLDVQDILKLTSNTSVSDKIRLDSKLGEFIDIDKDQIVFKSAIASIELLSYENNRMFLIDLLSKVLLNAINLDSNRKYYYLKRSIISFSNFKLLNKKIPSDNLNKLAVEYYGEIQNYSFNKENQFFWLQFGIQRLDEKNYQLADKYFDNALSYAQKKGMTDFYQINAQKARGLVENIVENVTDISEAFNTMKEAHGLLIKDLDNVRNNQSYQLSQGRLYRRFYEVYKDRLEPVDSLKFQMIVQRFKSEIEKYLLENSDSQKVNESLVEINKIQVYLKGDTND